MIQKAFKQQLLNLIARVFSWSLIFTNRCPYLLAVLMNVLRTSSNSSTSCARSLSPKVWRSLHVLHHSQWFSVFVEDCQQFQHVLTLIRPGLHPRLQCCQRVLELAFPSLLVGIRSITLYGLVGAAARAETLCNATAILPSWSVPLLTTALSSPLGLVL